jgi:hypothetical protein
MNQNYSMNKILLYTFVSLTMASCNFASIGQIIKSSDSFEKCDLVSYTYCDMPEERTSAGLRAFVTFKSTKYQDGTKHDDMFIRTESNMQGYAFSAKAYLEINQSQYPINLQSVIQKHKKEDMTDIDVNGISTISTVDVLHNQVMTRIAPSLIEQLRDVKSMKIRLYQGPFPITLTPSIEELAKVRELLAMW